MMKRFHTHSTQENINFTDQNLTKSSLKNNSNLISIGAKFHHRDVFSFINVYELILIFLVLISQFYFYLLFSAVLFLFFFACKQKC